MTDLEAFPADVCPDCGRTLDHTSYEQPALFRHAGYGASARTVVRHCPCGWRLVAERSEVKP